MRRLLACCQVDHPGGAEIGLLRLARRLLERDWDVTVTTPGEGPVRDAAMALGCGWTAIDCGGLASGAGARAVGSWPKAMWLSRDHDATLLNGTVAGRLLPALRGRRTLLHVHDMVTRVPRHWRGADVVLADSEAVARRLPDLDPVVVYCPVELDPPPSDPPWAPGPPGPVVGFVGRIEPRKGPLDLVLAAPAICAGAPGARIVVIGDDPYGTDPAYAAQVREGDHVEHHGWTDNAPGLMRHLDVLVAPSRAEPFGTVLSEAMAVGTPVVTTNVDGLPEVVHDGVDGALVDPGDVDALAAAVLRVLARRAEMGTAARASAQRFGADAYADRIEGLLLG